MRAGRGGPRRPKRREHRDRCSNTAPGTLLPMRARTLGLKAQYSGFRNPVASCVFTGLSVNLEPTSPAPEEILGECPGPLTCRAFGASGQAVPPLISPWEVTSR